MPHLDEGQLHALLDGAYAPDSADALRIRAHLAECAPCRAQLEQETALRQRAAVILRAARPGSEEVPPFTQVLQRADRAPARVRRAPTRLAWAASVVLALGAGWITRGMFPGWASFDRAPLESAPAASVTNTADRDAATSAAVPPPAPLTTGMGETDQGAGAKDRARQRDDQAAQEGRIAALAEPRATPPPAAVAPVAQPSAEAFAQKVVPTGARRTDSVTGRVAAAPPPPLEAPSRGQRTGERTAAERTAALQSQAAGAVGALADGALSWTTYTSQSEPERIARRSVLLIPDLELVNVGVASRAGSWLFRATQRLPDGNTIELLQEPILELNRAAAANFAERAAAQSRILTEEVARADETGAWLLTVRMGEVRVTARAALPSDSLRALLKRLR